MALISSCKIIICNHGRKFFCNYQEIITKNVLLQRSCRPRKNFTTTSVTTLQEKHEKNTKVINLSDPEIQVKLAALKVELQIFRDYGSPYIPDHVSERHWLEILKLPTKSSRLKYYKFLRITELKGIQAKEEHKQLKELRFAEKQKGRGHIVYGLNENTIMFQVRKATMNEYYDNNLYHALFFGQDLIFDMGFEEKMSSKELSSCLKQIRNAIFENRRDPEPFRMHFCNVSHNSFLMNRLKSSVSSLRRENSLISVTDQNYLDMFPKEKLVYLTPHCYSDLEFAHDKVYIIGGLVDKSQQGSLSLAKAKREGICMARLPINKYLKWKHGHKSLSLTWILKILLTVRNTSDWVEAFKCIPENKYTKY